MSPLQTSVISAVSLLTGAILLKFLTRKKHPLPPGPTGLPIIGNLLDFPAQGFDWEIYAKWADEYGPIISLSAPGMTVVVVNSFEKAIEMMEKKSSKYSSRPYFTMAIDLMGWQDAFAFTGYGPRFRGYRKVFHDQLGNAKAISVFHPQEESHARKFIRDILQDPSHLREHCFQHAGAIILRIAYGYIAQDHDDPFIKIGNIAMETFNQGCSPSRFMVNQIPALRFVPEWVPGAGFQRIAREWRGLYGLMIDTPFNYVKEQLAAGTAEESFAGAWLKKNLSPLEEDYLKNAAGSMFGGGGETTAVSAHFFFLAMILYPEVQEKLHQELDSVVGHDRLPSFEDQHDLPYLEGVVKEVLRFFPSVPYGLPHATSEVDIQDGYYIPQGAIVIGNTWKMCRDPSVYSSPEKFDPERFMGSNPELDPSEIIFGFGRRICPGRHLALSSIYITIAMAAAAFDVAPTRDESGTPTVPEIKGSGGIVNHLDAFPCTITPRNRKMLESLVGE